MKRILLGAAMLAALTVALVATASPRFHHVAKAKVATATQVASATHGANAACDPSTCPYGSCKAGTAGAATATMHGTSGKACSASGGAACTGCPHHHASASSDKVASR